MQKYFNTILDEKGDPIGTASVLVKTPAGDTATIYSDNSGTTTGNPLSTSSTGYFEFYAPNGLYSIVITKTGKTTITIDNILLDDPTVATIAALKAAGVPTTANTRISVLGYTTAGDGGGGDFYWVTGDQSANVTADPQSGIWVAPTSAPTGASGAWKRIGDATDIRMWGAVADDTGNGTGTDNAASINAYGTYLDTLGGGTIFIPEVYVDGSPRYFRISSSLVSYEKVRIRGAGRSNYVSGDVAGGSWLIYTGTGNAITIDGEWTGFVSRRSIDITGVNIKCTAAANAGIYADFLTQYNIEDVLIKGAPAYGIYFTNSYNGTMCRVQVDGAAVGHYATIKASPDDVFSGQALYESCDFWNCTSHGVHFVANDNVLSQIHFDRCHFKTNGGNGLRLDGANAHRIHLTAPHFEDNTGNDLHIVDGAVVAVHVVSGHFNSDNNVYKAYLGGNGSVLESCKFIGTDTAGVLTGWGVYAVGDDNAVLNCQFTNNVAERVIRVATTANRTRIKNPQWIAGTYSKGQRIFHEARTNVDYDTVYLDGKTVVSQLFDLSAASASSSYLNSAVNTEYLALIRIAYQEATSADAGIVITAGQPSDLTAYASMTTTISKAVNTYDSYLPAAMTSTSMTDGQILVVRSPGSKVGTGNVIVQAVIVPYPI